MTDREQADVLQLLRKLGILLAHSATDMSLPHFDLAKDAWNKFARRMRILYRVKMVRCSFCTQLTPKILAHRDTNTNSWIGDECWDERMRNGT